MTTTVSRLAADREQMAATLRHTRRGRCCDASAAASEPEDAISVVEECCRRQPLVVADGWGAGGLVGAAMAMHPTSCARWYWQVERLRASRLSRQASPAGLHAPFFW